MFNRKKIKELQVENDLLSQKVSSLEGKNTKLINNLDDLEKLIVLCKKHRTDLVEVEGVKVVVTKHEYPDTPIAAATNQEDDEDLLYYSAT